MKDVIQSARSTKEGTIEDLEELAETKDEMGTEPKNTFERAFEQESVAGKEDVVDKSSTRFDNASKDEKLDRTGL